MFVLIRDAKPQHHRNNDARRVCIQNTGPGHRNTTHVLQRAHKSKGLLPFLKAKVSVNILVSAVKNVRRILSIEL